MSDRSVAVRLTMNAQDFLAGAKAASSSLEDLAKKGDATGKVAATGLGRMEQSARLQSSEWATVGGHLTKVGAATAALGTAVAVTGVNYNRLQQSSRAALTTIQGTSTAANAQMDKLDAFAKTSPFSKATFITAQQQLLAFGVEAQKVVPYLDAVQNSVAAAGGNNTTLAGIVEIMAKIQSSAKITAMDLNQFGNWGVNAADLIGSAMGKTGAQIREEITAGTLDAGVALDALAEGMQTKFGGASANLKQTFDGAMDRVKAAWRDVSAELMEPFVGKQGGGLFTGLLNQVADLLRLFQKLPQPLKDFTVGMGAAVTSLALGGGAFMLITPKIFELHKALTGLSTAGIPVISRVAASVTSAGPKMVSALQQVSSGFDALRTSLAYASDAGSSKLYALQQGGGAALRGLASGAKTAGSAVVSALGGWPTIAAGAAIAGVTMAIMDMERKAQAARQMARKLKDTLDEVTGATTSDTKAAVLEEMFERAGAAAWKASGQTDAFAAAAGRLDIKKMQELRDAFALETVGSFRWEGDSKVLGDMDYFIRSAKEMGEQTVLADQVMGDAAKSAENLGESTEEAAEGFEAAASAASNYLAALKGLVDWQDAQADSISKANKAQRDWLDTIADANALIEKNGQNWDINTEAGRENRAMVDNLADAWRTNVDAMINAVDANGNMVYTLDEVKATAQSSYEQFLALAQGLGASEEEAQFLAESLGLLPEDVETRYLLALEGLKELKEIRAMLDGLPPEVITKIMALGDDAIEVAQAVADMVEAGIPEEKIVEILAMDSTEAILAGAQAAIDDVQQRRPPMILADNQTKLPTTIAQRNIDGVKQKTVPSISVIDNASPTLSNIRGLLAAIQSKTVTVHANYTNSGSTQMGQQVPGKASGGPVFGPGTETSDSILYRLSNNEHVVTAAEVSGAGGHQNLFTLRRMMRSGELRQVFGFAGGGTPAMVSSSVPASSYARPVLNSQPAPVNVEVQAFVENPFTGEEVEARMARTVVKFTKGDRGWR